MIIVLFGGGDGGGIEIVNGRLRRIPPNNPDVLRAISAAQVFQAAQTIRDAGLKKQALQLAQSLAAGKTA